MEEKHSRQRTEVTTILHSITTHHESLSIEQKFTLASPGLYLLQQQQFYVAIARAHAKRSKNPRLKKGTLSHSSAAAYYRDAGVRGQLPPSFWKIS